MTRNLMFRLPLLLLLLGWQAAAAQSGRKVLKEFKEEYPDENAVFVESRQTLNLSMTDTGLSISVDHYKDLLLLNDKAANVYNVMSASSNSFNIIEDLKAYTMVPDFFGYDEVPATNIDTTDYMSAGIFFNDSKLTKVTYGAAGEGTRLVMDYTERITEPHFVSPFFFGSYAPMDKAVYTVVVEEGIEIGYKTFNFGDYDIKMTKTPSKNGTVYRWEATNVPDIQSEDRAPSLRYYEPHLVVYVTSYPKGGERVRVLGEVKDLYKWYSDLTHDLETNSDPDQMLNGITDSLVAGKTTDSAKAHAIFRWVQNNIKYVAFEDSLGGFIPRKAAKVCRRRYGDCKDMANLITQMMTHAGLEAHRTWIGSRDLPYTYTEMPTLNVDNHMIAAAKIDGEYIFFDATGSNIPYGFPTRFIQGKQALIGLSKDEYLLKEVPIVEKEKNYLRDSVYIKLNGRKIYGSGNANYHGYQKLYVDYKMRTNLTETNRDAFWISELGKGNNKFLVDSVHYEGQGVPELPLNVDYTFDIDDYAVDIGSEAYVNLILAKRYTNSSIDLEKRKLDREFSYQYVDDYITVLELPEGSEVAELPENVSYKHDEFGFSIEYEKQDGKVVMRQRIYIDTLLLAPETMPEWNEMIDAMNTAYKQAITLKKLN